jgi:hemerythrin superfamily protein
MPKDMLAPSRASASASKDAIALLKSDHKEVSKLFSEFEKTQAMSKKKAIVAKICAALKVHAQIEEEIFYPAVKAALKDKVLVPEAFVEQDGMKSLMAQLESSEQDREVYNAKLAVLSEYVKHHVKEEHNEMFPKAKASKLDLMALGAKLSERKTELLANL